MLVEREGMGCTLSGACTLLHAGRSTGNCTESFAGPRRTERSIHGRISLHPLQSPPHARPQTYQWTTQITFQTDGGPGITRQRRLGDESV